MFDPRQARTRGFGWYILLMTLMTFMAPAEADDAVHLGHLMRKGRAVMDYYYFVPEQTRGVLVSVHGISRNAEEHARLWSAHARRYGLAVIAPLFEPERHRGYQRLESVNRGPKSDRLLLRLLDQAAHEHGLDTRQVYLFGFSGGGQFAHRFAMRHPQRVRALGIGAAGWYTWPDTDIDYPLGLGRSRDRGMPRRFDLSGFLDLPICVAVGSDDRRRDSSLNTAEDIDRLEGRHRLARARNWISALKQAGGQRSDYRLLKLKGIGHSFEDAMRDAKLGKRMLRCLVKLENAT